jgi:hypothetical protein
MRTRSAAHHVPIADAIFCKFSVAHFGGKPSEFPFCKHSSKFERLERSFAFTLWGLMAEDSKGMISV